MTASIIIQREAEADLSEAFSWYEARQAGLGDALLAEVDRMMGLIAEDPHRPRPLHRGARRVVTRRFPYAIFYVPRGEAVYVIAVLHHRRKPSLFRERVRGFREPDDQ